MANIEKLVKSLEALRISHGTSGNDDISIKLKKEPSLGKKDKILNCNIVADCICSPSVSSAAEFPKFLGICMETFITLIDDSDVDIKMVADECLNRVIRVLMKSNLGRIQVELYKEIKKNAAPRCVRAALWRFAELAHLILPQKCRPYVVNLLPCLVRICQRSEEMVHETLAAAMSKISPILVSFMTDMETKMLLKSFLTNLRSPSFTIRRSAAHCLLLVCQHSRKPATFTVWTLNVLLDSVKSAEATTDGATSATSNKSPVEQNLIVQDVPGLLGVLHGLRNLVPLMCDASLTAPDAAFQLKGSFGAKVTETDTHIDIVLVLQVLQLVIGYMKHADHNVVTASLEVLHQMLKHASQPLRAALVSRGDVGELLAQTSQNIRSFSRLPSVSDDMAAADVEDISASEDQVVDVNESSAASFKSDQFTAGLSRLPDVGDTDDDDDDDDEIFEAPDVTAAAACEMVSSAVTASNDYSGIDVGLAADTTLSPSSSYDTFPSVPESQPEQRQPEQRQSEQRQSSLPSSGDDEDEDALSLVIGESAAEPRNDATTENTAAVRHGDIGSLTDDDELPVVFIARMLCSEFLLTGYICGLLPDHQVRVSVKALALSCVGHLVDLYPQLIVMCLHKNSSEPGELQLMSEVLIYTSHCDPQLRGNAALVIGRYVRAVLGESRGSWDKWTATMRPSVMCSSSSSSMSGIHELVMQLCGLLEDESAVTVRLAVSALKLCMPSLSHSCQSSLAMKLLLAVMPLKHNSYWLVKVELLELLADIDYKFVVYLESVGFSSLSTMSHRFLGKLDLQQRVLTDVLLKLVGDEDQRVRHAAAVAFCRVVPTLFNAADNTVQDAAVAKAVACTAGHFAQAADDRLIKSTPYLDLALKPFDDVTFGSQTVSSVECALSRVVTMVVHALMQSTSHSTSLGCCHALRMLSETYSVMHYAGVWGCDRPTTAASLTGSMTACIKKRGRSLSGGSGSEESCRPGSGGGPLSLIVSLLTSSPLSLDLSAHVDLLQLAGTLFAGAAYKCLRSASDVSESSVEDPRWPSLSDRLLVNIANQLLLHLIRLLNICAHIVDETTPGPPPAKPTLPSLPNPPSLSPIRRRGRGGKEDTSSPQATPAKEKGSTRTPSKDAPGKEHENKDMRVRKEGHGAFYMLPHYMKLYDVLKGAYSIYKMSLDLSSVTDKFVCIVKTMLTALSQLLEVSCLVDIGKYAEELLSYLCSTIGLDPADTVLCVQQLLKAIFGTNLAGQWDSHVAATALRPPVSRGTARSSAAVKPGIYHVCLNQPYIQLTQAMASTTTKIQTPVTSGTTGSGSAAGVEHDDSTSALSWLTKRADKKLTAVSKPSSKSTAALTSDKTSVASYIRLFEPLVIKSLKQYTVTSQVVLQQQVLDLLAQLVQLRVNYCLLDSDQIFIGYIIKQFEFIEQGQMRNANLLIPNIFNFLILLSYERYHTKTIIQMPKVIQLCDGIMASGQDPTTHAFPALQCVVFDLFIVRPTNKSNLSKDLETQQEVVISMLLRLLQHHQIVELFVIVLQQCRRDSEERWKRMSRQVVDFLLPLLQQQQVSIDRLTSLDIVHRLFESVAASVFRPIDILLKVLFARPNKLKSVVDIERWVSLVLVSLRVVLTQSKEEVVLGRLQQLGLTICFTDAIVGVEGSATDCTHQPHAAEAAESANPDVMFAKFLMQVIQLIVTELSGRRSFHSLSSTSPAESCDFLCQELSHLLLYVTHMFQSGICRRVAVAAMSLLCESENEAVLPQQFSLHAVNDAFLAISASRPTLMVQWCNILILLNYGEQSWWSQLLQTSHIQLSSVSSRCSYEDVVSSGTTHHRSINMEVVRRGALILFCDYVCENLNDAEHMTWLIINHVFDLVFLRTEPPVHDFMSAVHRNSAASGLLVQAVHSRSELLSKMPPSMTEQTLQCLKDVHLGQSGSLVTLLIECFLSTHLLALARLADSITCRRLEILLADTAEDGMNQLSVEDTDKLLHFMNKHQLSDRHMRLATLLHKLADTLKPDGRAVSLTEKPRPLSLTSGAITDVEVGKDWFVSVVTDLCCRFKVDRRLCVRLLQHLDYTSILNIIMHKNCSPAVLSECIVLGVKSTMQSYRKQSSVPHSPVASAYLPASLAINEPATLDSLLRAAELTLYRRINSVINMLPVPHQVVRFECRQTVDRYREHLEEVFSDVHCFHSVVHLSMALYSLLRALQLLPSQHSIPPESVKDVLRFAVVAMEMLHWTLSNGRLLSSDHVLAILNCFSSVLCDSQLVTLLSDRQSTSFVCSATTAVHTFVCSLCLVHGERLGRLPSPDSQDDFSSSSFNDDRNAIRACDQISELVDALSTFLNPNCLQQYFLPQYLTRPVRSVVTGLARLPLVNSYARTPPAVWKMGWMPSPAGELKTHLPPLPLDYLRERDVLADFICRVNTLGWTSRQQFEETWMSLLGVLNPLPSDSTETPPSHEELLERTQCQVLAARGVTALLIQSMLSPHCGNPMDSSFEHCPRNKPLAFFSTKTGRRLNEVRRVVELELQHSFSDSPSLVVVEPIDHWQTLFTSNVERSYAQTDDDYQLGQLSVESLWSFTGMSDKPSSQSDSETGSSEPPPATDTSSMLPTPTRSSQCYGLDIHSCLQLLTDVYGSTLLPSQLGPSVPITLFNETIRSITMLSDVFTDKSQFEWMLSTFLNIYRSHPSEDELTMQYLVVGVCKAAAVVGIDTSMVENFVKIVETALKSTHLATKMSALHGGLYLLEAGVTEMSHHLVPLLGDYVLRSLTSITPTIIYSEKHVLLMWSVAFYITENFVHELKEMDFVSKLFQLCVTIVSMDEEATSVGVYLAILHGLERLIIADCGLGRPFSDPTLVDAIIKLSIDRLCQPSPQRSLAALGLLLTCMYSGLSTTAVRSETPPSSADATSYNPEMLIIAMERVMVLFDRIRKGYPYEARVITRILPTFLMDFFPPQDVMNKVIAEFLSCQQPHPELMADVVFRVFEQMIDGSQTSVVHDWVVLSLSNFTQRTPLAMAVWSLTCFFISASFNSWLRALMPLAISRIGRLDVIDEQLFYVAARDFYSQLDYNESHRRAFTSTFRSVAATDTPYTNILTFCSFTQSTES